MAQVLQFPKWEPIDRARVSDLQRQVWHMVFHCCAVGMFGHVLVYKLMYELMEMSND